MKGNWPDRSGTSAATISGIVVVGRIALDFAFGGWSSHHWTHLLACTAVGGLLGVGLAHGIWSATTSRERSAPPGPPPVVWSLWIGILLLAVAFLPAAFQPNQHSLISLLVFGSLLAVPAAYADRPSTDAVPPSITRRIGAVYQVLPYALILVALISSIIYVNASRRSIGSVDFFYYICAARDMLAPDVEVSDDCYSYFPGVYAFWRTVMQVIGSALPRLQSTYVVLLVCNALIIAAILGRATRSVLASSFSAVWYLVLASRFEGLAGVSEPLATAVLLLGCLIWNGQPLCGRRGFIVTFLLGTALGLTVYAKQQAGLLTLGTISLLVLRPSMAPDRRHGWSQLALLPVIAVAALTFGILMEGRGWIPLIQGLNFATGYGTESSLVWNLYTQIRGDESAALAAMFMVVACCHMFLRGDRQLLADSPQFQLASFSVLAFLFAQVQFLSRPFGHYMLLAIPWLILGSVLLGRGLLDQFRSAVDRSLLVRALLFGAVAVLLFNTSGRVGTLYVWRWQLPPGFQANQLWHKEPTRLSDITTALEVVEPGSTMYILPPRRNSIYYLLGTHTASPEGYTFFETDLELFPWQDCRYFILLTQGLDEFDYQFSSPERLQDVHQLLIDQDFRLRDDLGLRTMELFERPE